MVEIVPEVNPHPAEIWEPSIIDAVLFYRFEVKLNVL